MTPAAVRTIFCHRGRDLTAAVLLCLWASVASAQPDTPDLKRLTLEELLEMEVTLATRRPEPVNTAAAAITVITRDQIRRSGVTTIADALALADGMIVARFNNASWAITARGFNGSTPNKLLVMVDGRNSFSPFFTGVFWNMVDYVLEDIERIEVIRGPGATLWGANAVNGVVNIVTRHSRDTRGTFASVGSGNEDPALVDFRYGGGSDTRSYRVYAKSAIRADQKFSSGDSANDSRVRAQAGFRFDRSQGRSAWLFKGDAFHSRDEFIDRDDGEWTELTAQARFTRELDNAARLQVQSYYRREYRNIPRQLTHHVDTGDVDVQYSARAGKRHDFVSGLGLRVNRDRTYPSAVLSFDPVARTYPVYSAFVQDEFAVRPQSIFLTAGLKLEHNAFSGADWQPNVRARWMLPDRQILWGAVARAVRRPTRFDDDIRVTSDSDTLLVQGNDDFESEVMNGWEIGYRAQPITPLSIDVTAFAQRYDNLRSQEAPVVGVLPITVGNTLRGHSRGVEIAATMQPTTKWLIRASYAFLNTDVERNPGSRDVSAGANEANDPSHVFSVRAAFEPRDDLEADVWLRGVGALTNPAVPAYAELDARIGWRVNSSVDLALVGQDLLHGHHPEFGPPIPRRIEFERSVRLVFTLRAP